MKKRWHNQNRAPAKPKQNYKPVITDESQLHQTEQQIQNEFLASLIEKYGLNKLKQNGPHRSTIWKQITNEFNQVTGSNYESHKLSKRWSNSKRSTINETISQGLSTEDLSQFPDVISNEDDDPELPMYQFTSHLSEPR